MSHAVAGLIPRNFQSHFFAFVFRSPHKLIELRRAQEKVKWLNSPNAYQKVEIQETGTSDPKKITKVKYSNIVTSIFEIWVMRNMRDIVSYFAENISVAFLLTDSFTIIYLALQP